MYARNKKEYDSVVSVHSAFNSPRAGTSPASSCMGSHSNHPNFEKHVRLPLVMAWKRLAWICVHTHNDGQLGGAHEMLLAQGNTKKPTVLQPCSSVTNWAELTWRRKVKEKLWNLLSHLFASEQQLGGHLAACLQLGLCFPFRDVQAVHNEQAQAETYTFWLSCVACTSAAVYRALWNHDRTLPPPPNMITH